MNLEKETQFVACAVLNQNQFVTLLQFALHTISLEEMSELCLVARSKLNLQEILCDPNTLTQFILDPTSFNLKSRVDIGDPIVTPLFNLSRDLCNCINIERMKRLNNMKKNQG